MFSITLMGDFGKYKLDKKVYFGIHMLNFSLVIRIDIIFSLNMKSFSNMFTLKIE